MRCYFPNASHCIVAPEHAISRASGAKHSSESFLPEVGWVTTNLNGTHATWRVKSWWDERQRGFYILQDHMGDETVHCWRISLPEKGLSKPPSLLTGSNSKPWQYPVSESIFSSQWGAVNGITPQRNCPFCPCLQEAGQDTLAGSQRRDTGTVIGTWEACTAAHSV